MSKPRFLVHIFDAHRTGDLMARGAAIQAYYSSRVRSQSSNRMQVRVSKTPSAAAMVGISHHSAMPEAAKCPHAVFHP